ncbi:hypothetical protein OPQ81_011234 [Rhizoctonia solani]|nr:hypothetical protein OPQ81_011234 [Rhizoctonia solani]
MVIHCDKPSNPQLPSYRTHEVQPSRDGRWYESKSNGTKNQSRSWTPKNPRVINQYVSRLLAKVDQDKRPVEQLHPTIVEFKNLIDTSPALRRGFTQMFEQVPTDPPYDKDPCLKLQIRDYDTMFKAFNYIITHSIPHEDHAFVGFPINAILFFFIIRLFIVVPGHGPMVRHVN